MHVSLRFDKDNVWVKKDNHEMWLWLAQSCDGTELCELVSLYLLEFLIKAFD